MKPNSATTPPEPHGNPHENPTRTARSPSTGTLWEPHGKPTKTPERNPTGTLREPHGNHTTGCRGGCHAVLVGFVWSCAGFNLVQLGFPRVRLGGLGGCLGRVLAVLHPLPPNTPHPSASPTCVPSPTLIPLVICGGPVFGKNE